MTTKRAKNKMASSDIYSAVKATFSFFMIVKASLPGVFMESYKVQEKRSNMFVSMH